jgi:ABC-type sugar transport system ATPase subunit
MTETQGIVLKDLVKRYKSLDVVKKINLEINPKEFVVLVGPSGCGKSTTLRMIAGLEEISGGEISIGTRVVNDLSPKDRNIAMVFQNYALYPHMSVAENMSFALKMAGVGREEIDARVNEAAEILGLGQLLERRPGELSGGQRQRVAMGRAIVRRPQVFLFDEPLSNLDAKLRIQMRSEIKKLHQRLNATIVYVTHDQVEAMTLADKIVVMKDGRIEQMGSPLEIYKKPANTFVASFIGAPPMNLLKENAYRDGKILGIRPEHLSLSSGEVTFEGEIDLVEPLGGETLVHLKINNENLIARVDCHFSGKMGEKTKLYAKKSDLHFFDKNTEKAI